MEVKSAILYGKIEEEVYVCQPLGFEDLDFPDRVYKVEKALYGLHQAPKAWYETLSTYMLDNGFQRRKINKTLFIKRHKGYTEVKTASTPMETQKPLLKDEDGEEVDVHMYRSMIGSLMYLTSSRPDIIFYAVVSCARSKSNPKLWSTVKANTINKEVQLHALVDDKKIIITESTVRRDLQLEDAKGVECLPNSTIFEQLTLIGSKTTAWNEFSSTMASCLSPKTTAWNEFSSTMASAIIYEAIHKELGGSLVRAATTTFSLEAEQDSGNINKTQSKATPNESSSLGTTSGGGPRCQETMGDTIAQTRFKNVSKHSNVSLLAKGFYELCSETKTTSNIIRLLFEKNGIFQEVEKKNRSRTHKLKRLYKVGLTAKVESSDNEESLGEDASKQGRIDAIDADEEITLKQNTAGDATTTGDDGDITLAQARIKMKSTKPKNKEKRAGTKLIQENARKQKVKDNKETTELKQCLEIIPDEEEVTIDVIPLAVKSPSIVGWKIHKEGRKSYYQIMRADGKSQMYMIFSHMLKSFNREDLEDLYKLVKAKYKSTRPVEDLDLLLWGDLKTMFEPHVEDKIWRNQQDYKVLDWKLYDSCGVHSLRMQHMQIYMLVEKKYPLAPLTLSMMLEKKLIIDYESEMAYQLLKFIIKQLKNIKELFWKVISWC
ncbi:ribonuclease H-like domain-containing protein [Tanacetum coccineum]